MTTFNVPWPVWTLVDDESDAHLFKHKNDFLVMFFTSEEYANDFISRGNLDCVSSKFDLPSNMKSFLSAIPGKPSLNDPSSPVFILIDAISPAEAEGYPIPRKDFLAATSHMYDK